MSRCVVFRQCWVVWGGGAGLVRVIQELYLAVARSLWSCTGITHHPPHPSVSLERSNFCCCCCLLQTSLLPWLRLGSPWSVVRLTYNSLNTPLLTKFRIEINGNFLWLLQLIYRYILRSHSIVADEKYENKVGLKLHFTKYEVNCHQQNQLKISFNIDNQNKIHCNTLSILQVCFIIGHTHYDSVDLWTQYW